MKKKYQGKNIAVIGGGSWGTALVKILSENVGSLHWWIRNPETVKYIHKFHHNPKYLGDVEIDIKKCQLDNDLEKVIASSEIIVVAVPAAFVKNTFQNIAPSQLKSKVIVSAVKGMIPGENLIIGEFFNRKYKVPFEKIVIISGPCHAEEVAMEKLSYLTIASPDTTIAAKVASQLNCRFIKTTVSDDIYGTEYAAVLKNIIAIASGICHGLGYGDNFQAVLISNAIQEIKKFVDTVHPIDRDIKDSAYLGDLLVTAYSQFSRNRTFGNMIGKGYSVKSAQMEMNMVAEGYFAVKSIESVRKKFKIEMPITEAVYHILYEKSVPAIEVHKLTERLK